MNLMDIPKRVPFSEVRAVPVEVLRACANVAFPVRKSGADFRVVSFEHYSIDRLSVRKFRLSWRRFTPPSARRQSTVVIGGEVSVSFLLFLLIRRVGF